MKMQGDIWLCSCFRNIYACEWNVSVQEEERENVLPLSPKPKLSLSVWKWIAPKKKKKKETSKIAAPQNVKLNIWCRKQLCAPGANLRVCGRVGVPILRCAALSPHTLHSAERSVARMALKNRWFKKKKERKISNTRTVHTGSLLLPKVTRQKPNNWKEHSQVTLLNVVWLK